MTRFDVRDFAHQTLRVALSKCVFLATQVATEKHADWVQAPSKNKQKSPDTPFGESGLLVRVFITDLIKKY